MGGRPATDAKAEAPVFRTLSAAGARDGDGGGGDGDGGGDGGGGGA